MRKDLGFSRVEMLVDDTFYLLGNASVALCGHHQLLLVTCFVIVGQQSFQVAF